MKTISDVDQNMKVVTKLDIPGLKYYNVLEKPMQLHGIFHEDGMFRRLPEQVAKDTSGGVHWLHANTAGGRVRFRTDSPYIALFTEMPQIYIMHHFAITGSSSFDLYVRDEDGKERFAGGFPRDPQNLYGFETVIHLDGEGVREYTIHFPLYANVNQVFIGLDENSVLEAPAPYTIEKPVVFYGSSITQGGCASRPGTSYESMVSRRFDFDYINLGFSGSAQGEQVMVDYIASLDMSAFVLDYDHNTPDVEHLTRTHENFYQTVRRAHPDIPIIMLSAPKYRLNDTFRARRDVIETTYRNAIQAGDKNVWFLDGPALMEMAKDDGTVDGCHPTDLGFASMAKALGDLMEKIYE